VFEDNREKGFLCFVNLKYVTMLFYYSLVEDVIMPRL